jgi:hypothetical protein
VGDLNPGPTPPVQNRSRASVVCSSIKSNVVVMEIFVSLQMLLFQQGQEMVLTGVARDPTGTWVGDMNPGSLSRCEHLATILSPVDFQLEL